MRQDKKRMRRIGGLLLEVLVLVFVFSYSYYWSDDLKAEHASASQDKLNSEIVLRNFSIPTSLNDQTSKTKIKFASIESTFFTILPHLLLSADSKGISTPFAPINLYYSNTTINAP